jgi:hypothetical protein
MSEDAMSAGAARAAHSAVMRRPDLRINRTS